MNITFNHPTFTKIFKAIELGHQNILVSGKAGTGKSTLLKHIAAKTEKNIIVLAPTGLAAINAGGVTIHSFFKLPVRPMVPGDKSIPVFDPISVKYEVIRNADLIIIDEISMVRADLLDAVDHSLKINCKSNAPFGGKQVLLFGDMFQLEPIVPNGDERKFMDDYYPSSFFFDAYAYRQGNFIHIELEKVFRQKDPTFIKTLNKIRTGDFNNADLQWLNDSCYQQQKIEVDQFSICLCTSNKIASAINQRKMDQIKGDIITFEGRIEGNYNPLNTPTAKLLHLKLGAKVMILKNGNGYANGSIGILESVNEQGCCLVRLADNTLHVIEPYTWEQLDFKYNKRERKIISSIVGTYVQIPLIPAWAITIHKSQGLTFDTVHLDLGQGTFAAGQAYVGLSRCRSIVGLSFARKCYAEDIKVHQRALEFMRPTPSKSSKAQPTQIQQHCFSQKPIIEIESYATIYN